MEDPKDDKKISIGCLTILVILALAGASWVGYRIYREQETYRWLKTRGTIVESSFEVTEWDNERSSGQYYQPIVSYEYVAADDRPYRSSGVYLYEVKFAWKEDLEDLLARFAKGKSVDVFYSPSDPLRSVLIPGMSPTLWTYYLKDWSWRAIAGLAVLMLVGLFIAFLGRLHRIVTGRR